MSFLTIRKKWGFKFLTIFALLMMYCSLITSGIVSGQDYSIPAGTVISVKTTSEISPEDFSVGDKVDLVVAKDVVVKGKVLIKAGAPVKAEITSVQKKGIVGAAAKIGLTLLNARAVDDNLIPLSGTKVFEGKDKVGQSIIFTLLCCILFLLMPGEDAVIPADFQIDGTVAGTVEVSI